MSAGGSSDSSSTDSKVWGGQSPFLEGLYQNAADMFQGFNPQTQVPGQAMQAWQGQLNQGPGQNPYLDSMAGRFQDQLGVMNQSTGGQAGLTGGYGGGRHGVAESQNVQNMGQQMGQFYGGQYQQDMNRQQQGIQQAIGQTPMMMGMDPWQQRMGALQQTGNIFGNPTVLGEGSSSGKSANVGLK